MPGLGQRRKIQLPDVQAAPLPPSSPMLDSHGYVLSEAIPLKSHSAHGRGSDRKSGKLGSKAESVTQKALNLTCSSAYEVLMEREEEEIQVHEDYDFIEQIGRGSSSTVWRAVSRAPGPTTTVAIKEYMRSGEGEMECFAEREFDMLRTLHHRNIVRPVNLYLGEKIYLALEYVPGKTLEEIPGPYSEAACRNVLRQLLNALFYLHSSKHICHRDVKPSNIVAVEPSRLEMSLIVLIDFNIASQFQSTPIGFSDQPCIRGEEGSAVSSATSTSGMITPTGTCGYMAPEVFAGGNGEALHEDGQNEQSPLTRYLSRHQGVSSGSSYNEKVDVWSAGQVLKHMLQDGEGRMASNVSPGGVELMEAMTASDSVSRPSVQQCLVHSWLVETTEYEDAMNAVRRSRREHKSKTTTAQFALNKTAALLEERRAARAACRMQVVQALNATNTTTTSNSVPGPEPTSTENLSRFNIKVKASEI